MKDSCTTNRVRAFLAGAAALAMMLPLASSASGALKPEFRDNPELMKNLIQENAEDLAERSREMREPTENGEIKVLEAVIMQVQGRAQWIPDEENAEWRTAEVDDVVPAGATIRTGGNSSVTLFIGLNATLLVDSRTRITLPEIVQDGDVLRTRAGLERGRADVKVDEVGLTNDFSIITPSSTLAVRGTGFAVQYGGYSGTTVHMARVHEMMSVELRYFLSRLSFLLTQNAISSEDLQNPVLAALFRTIGLPAIMSALIEDEATAEILAQGFERIVVWQELRTLQGIEGLNATLNLPFFQLPDDFNDVMPEDPFGAAFLASLAQFICMNLGLIFDNYEVALLTHEVVAFPPEQLGDAFQSIMAHCKSVDVFGSDDWQFILDQIVAFCHSLDLSQDKWHLCVTVFGNAIVEANPDFKDFFDSQFHKHF